MPTRHAILAPSAAKRWLTCTPSARLEAQIPKPDTAFTIEGTIAHGIAETLLDTVLSASPGAVPTLEEIIKAFDAKAVDPELDVDFHSYRQQANEQGLDFNDMVSTVYEYYCRPILEDFYEARQQDKDAILKVEQTLKLDEYIPEGFGSSDAVLIAGDLIRVYDLKYGKGVKVFAEDNPQMMCYALGALCGPGELYDLHKVQMTIIQPRLRHISTWGLTTTELLEWALKVLNPAAQKAFNGEGEFVPGDHCRFCAAASRCKALKATAEVIVKAGDQPELMSDVELAATLANLELVKGWVKAVEDTALNHMLEGKTLPGFKLVEGKSLRKIGDQAEAIKALEAAGFGANDYLKPAELKTITDLEKLLRKQGFKEILGPFVVKPQGKATIAPESDPRPALGDATSDFDSLNI